MEVIGVREIVIERFDFQEQYGDKLSEHLKPCPFCGSRAYPIIVKGEKYKAICIECEECGARSAAIENKLISYWKPCAKNDWKSTVEQASKIYAFELLNNWNRRTIDG